MDGDYGRIHRVAFKAVISLFFTTATLAAIGRLFTRFHYQKRLFTDDYLLLFAYSSLIAAFTITNVMFEDIYFAMSFDLGPGALVMQESVSTDFVNRVLRYQQLSFSTEILCWVTIFAVKISFLLFFRQLINRLQTLVTYWKVTVGIVIVSGIFCFSTIFISCSHFGISSIECDQGTGFTRTIVVTQLASAVNMLTDLLIIAVPISLLWKAHILLSQKIILSSFLCLSVCMFALCLVRTAGETIHGNTGITVDVQWNVFWQLTEGNVAVTVVSLSAFRSLYGIKTLQLQKDKNRNQAWLSSYRKNMLNRRKQRRVDEFGDPISEGHYSLPTIPGATLIGIRTMTGGRTAESTQALSMRGDPLAIDEAQEEELGLIRVVHDVGKPPSTRTWI